MGKHAKVTAVATTVEPRDLAYWHRILVEAQKKDAQLIVDRCYAEFDKLLDAKLAAQ